MKARSEISTVHPRLYFGVVGLVVHEDQDGIPEAKDLLPGGLVRTRGLRLLPPP